MGYEFMRWYSRQILAFQEKQVEMTRNGVAFFVKEQLSCMCYLCGTRLQFKMRVCGSGSEEKLVKIPLLQTTLLRMRMWTRLSLKVGKALEHSLLFP